MCRAAASRLAGYADDVRILYDLASAFCGTVVIAPSRWIPQQCAHFKRPAQPLGAVHLIGDGLVQKKTTVLGNQSVGEFASKFRVLLEFRAHDSFPGDVVQSARRVCLAKLFVRKNRGLAAHDPPGEFWPDPEGPLLKFLQKLVMNEDGHAGAAQHFARSLDFLENNHDGCVGPEQAGPRWTQF